MLTLSSIAKAGWYETASDMHKKWANKYHTEKDSVRYTNVHTDVIGHLSLIHI